MNENLTEIVCIIDRSTSIRSSNLIASTIEGFNALLAKQKTEPGEARMTVALFDGDRNNPQSAYEIRYDGETLDLIEDLNNENFVPKGMTALYDAIGRTIDMIKTRQSNTPNDERPAKTIVAIMTDGEENSSAEYTKETVKKMIETMESEHGWSFLFLGAGIDAMSESGSLGMSVGNSLSYANTDDGTRTAYVNLSSVISKGRGLDITNWNLTKDSLMSDIEKEN
jgi:uncharacterized protein YegL